MRLSEEIASDALKLINMQFVIASLSVSGLGVVSSQGGDVNPEFAVIGAVITISSTLGTIYVYYSSRKRIYRYAKEFRRMDGSETIPELKFAQHFLSQFLPSSSLNTVKDIDVVSNSLDKYNELNSIAPASRPSRESYSAENNSRVWLLICTVGAVIGLSLIIGSVFEPAMGESFPVIAATLVAIALGLASLLPIFSQIVRLSEILGSALYSLFEFSIIFVLESYQLLVSALARREGQFLLNTSVFLAIFIGYLEITWAFTSPRLYILEISILMSR